MAPPTRTDKKQRQAQADKGFNRGAWAAEEDRKLIDTVGVHGPKQWTKIPEKAGLKRCAKSCRLRWMNYLRPNIKRGDFSDQEDDLIIRLHRLIGNRWSLIAGRLPGRTDNEIKNYWNTHLSKNKLCQEMTPQIEKGISRSTNYEAGKDRGGNIITSCDSRSRSVEGLESDSFFNVDDLFDFSNESPSTLDWVTKFLQFGDS